RPCDSSLFSSSSSASSPRRWRSGKSSQVQVRVARGGALLRWRVRLPLEGTPQGEDRLERRVLRMAVLDGREVLLLQGGLPSGQPGRLSERDTVVHRELIDQSISYPHSPLLPLSLIEIPLQDQTMAYSDVFICEEYGVYRQL
ncbi:hypothetical protein PENTCL1PPCAC_30360, partial [Pristionchus entomophagus]